MRRISSRSTILRALLCALVLLLALAPISGAAAATADEAQEVTTEAPATEVSATEAPAQTASTDVQTGDEAESVAEETEAATLQDTDATEEVTTQQADQDGPYTSDPDAPAQDSGNGQGKTPHESGSKGNADDKNPPGQMPGPDEDGDNGYECDGNNGIAKGNPAHTQCPPPDPRIAIDKTGPATSTHGATITYTMVVTNPGNRPLRNVVLTDPDCNSAPTRTAGDTNGDNVLQTTETWTYTCRRTIAQNAVSPLPNTATVAGTSPEDVTVTAQDSHSVTLLAPGTPVININKTGPATSTVGATVTYNLTVTNPGAQALRNVAVTDDKCDAAPVRTGGDASGDNILQTTETWSYTCSRVMQAGDAPSLRNVATVVGTSVDTDQQVSDDDDHVVTFPASPAADVTITKDPDLQTVVSGGTAEWTITVRNTGDVRLTGVRVSDVRAPNCDRNIGAMEIGAVQSWSCTLSGVTSPFTNVAVVHTNELPDRQDTADVNIVPGNPSPSILLRKTAVTPECPKAGDTVPYRFEVVNNGNQTLTSVGVNDPLLGGAVALPTTTLTPGQVVNATRSYSLTQSDIDAGTLQNTATATGTAGSNIPVTNSASATVMLEDCPGEIELVKDGPASAQVGEQITYTFTVTNTGDVPLTNVRITDQRLSILGLLVNPSTLNPGQQGTATATYVVTEADADDEEILNIAVVRARTPDNTEVDDEDDHRTTVPRTPEAPEPAIRLVKDGPAQAGVGETITYTFTVTNTGDVTLTNVNITDPLLGLQRLPVRPDRLVPGQQGTATATYVVTEADGDAGSIYNTAVARGRAPDGTPVRDRDDHTVTVPLVPPVPPVCVSPPCGPPPPPPPPELPATGIGTTGFALTALLSLALGGVLLGIAGSGNLQAAMAGGTVNGDSPLLAVLRQWNLAPKPGGAQARRRRRR